MRNFLSRSVNVLPLTVRSWIKYIPGVAACQRWLIDRVLSGRSFVHQINAGPARGLRCQIVLPRDKAFWTGTFELRFAETLKGAVREGDVCYDVGGYHGYMSGIFALAGASRVDIFEPLPKNIKQLLCLTRLNPALPFHVHNVAIGHADGMCTFSVMRDESMGKLSRSVFQPESRSHRYIEVEMARLDTCVFGWGLPAPNVVKIDVEGAEVDVIEGALRTFEKFRPIVFVEAHSKSLGEKCSIILQQIGYRIHELEEKRLPCDEVRHLVGRANGAP